MADNDETPEQPETPHTDDKPFYKDPVKLLPLLAILITIVIGAFQIYDRCCANKPAEVSVQYVLDVSSGMRGKLGKDEKLAAARASILGTVEGTPDVAYGLRLARPGCSHVYKKASVGFDTDNTDNFKRALTPVETQGKSNFAQNVTFAANDLMLQQRDGGSKRGFLILLVGGRDRCADDPAMVIGDALELLQKDKTVKVRFRFIGVKAPKAVRKFLGQAVQRAKRAGFNASAEFPDTADELDAAVQATPTPSATPTPPSP